jgi:tetratricopeptide (TPR) repeat protein
MLLAELKVRSANPVMETTLRREAAREALREAAGHPVAAAVLARADGASAADAIRGATAARPADGRGWYLLARETADAAEREAALKRAVELWPDGAAARSALAVHLASTGRAREALPFANQALDLAPWSPDAMAALARVALELGKCSEALQLQGRAVDIAEEGTLGPVRANRAELRSRLEAYRSRCAEAAPAKTAAPAR